MLGCLQVSEGSLILNLLTLVIHTAGTGFYEGRVGGIYNELAGILRKDLKQKEPTGSLYYICFYAKFHNYLHNFNFTLSFLMILGMRSIRWADIWANIYFGYCCLSRESAIFCYALLLLGFGEAMRLNSQQEPDSYGGFVRQLQRQERLKRLLEQVHRMFGWQVAANMAIHLYFNMAMIYISYSFMSQPPTAMRHGLSHVKILFSAIGCVVWLSDVLILQIICEYLLIQGNRLCPQVMEQEEQDKQDFVAAQRQVSGGTWISNRD